MSWLEHVNFAKSEFQVFNFEFCASRNYLNQLKYPRSKVRLAIKHHSGASWHLDIEEVFAEKSSEVRTGSDELQKRTLYLPKTTFSNGQRYLDLAIYRHIRLNWIALKLLISPLWWYLSSTQKMMVCVLTHSVLLLFRKHGGGLTVVVAKIKTLVPSCRRLDGKINEFHKCCSSLWCWLWTCREVLFTRKEVQSKRAFWQCSFTLGTYKYKSK